MTTAILITLAGFTAASLILATATLAHITARRPRYRREGER